VTALLWTEDPDGDRTYLDALGDMTALGWSFTSPGGPRELTGTLATDPAAAHNAVMPGRRCGVTVGSHDVWTGRLLDPGLTEAGVAISAVGDAARLDSLFAVAANAYDLTSVFERPGLDVNLAVSSVDAGITAASGSITIAQALNDVTEALGQTWNLRDSGVIVEDLPSTPAGRLLAPDDAGARTLADFASSLVVIYTATGTNARAVTVYDDPILIERWGRIERPLDLTGEGRTYTEAQAVTVAAMTLPRVGRPGFTGSFTVVHGDLLTTGGFPVELSTFRAGDLLEVDLLDVARGGDAVASVFTIVVAEYAYDASTDTAQITPAQSTRNSLTALLERAAA
jgi:hypothetical protein